MLVVSIGEAWYVAPATHERWYLGRPDDAFAVMRRLGLGITNANLSKIPRADSSDLGSSSLMTRLSGRILLQVEAHGEAWYVYPKDGHRYFLGRPDDAFKLMRHLGLGITDANLAVIPIASNSARVVVAETSVLPMPLGVGTPTSVLPSVGASVPPAIPLAFVPPINSVRGEMLGLVNAARHAMSVKEVVLNDAMNAGAERLADDMVARNYFAVKTPEGLGTKELLQEAGYDARATGVLLAGGPVDAETAFTLWNGGESSKDMMAKAEYEELGVGMAKGGERGIIWVVFFASSEAKYEQQIAVALSDMAAMRSAMLVRVNAERAKQNFPALVFNELLNQSAQKKSEDMFTRDYFAHESPDGVSPHQLITSTGYPAQTSAENLAKGPRTVDEVMTGWMNSPGHRANILFNGIEEAGFGLKLGRNASGFNIYWTQHFGKR
ncbi:hypothetical protein HY625_03170 [Candidatus Uhrbacteria bacterium]|nr:hypothetical protein [Candidatus Uhrbacteria bacterium]